MRRIVIARLSLLPVLFFVAVAWAGGYTGPGGNLRIDTVAAALKAADDTPLVLTGYIVRRIRSEYYEFRDETGTIRVEIDDKDWPQQPVSENTRVRLIGEVERGWFSREIDVDAVMLAP